MTSDAKEYVSWFNKFTPDREKIDAKEMDKCGGMAAYLDDRETHPFFAIYMAPGWETTTLFHEALHMAHFIMEHCSAPINLESTETQAYLMEHIVEKVQETTMSKGGHDTRNTYKHGLLYGPKGNRIYNEKPRPEPTPPGNPGRRNLDHMPK